ncbi:hypothetical protein K432DRAFT_380328 [Lepidopterella palustris CBS 459.81]|uniref:Uncharacterized protein n=1 Tax=Lepidopterella palustris CBS 459.81 TaxID=1314670 RepID=A0A8E2EER6_9PEZI|nr:hypothetical protein K432DRAFT_380328 [Lepidopterella palustris CBS 459.81]
MCNPSPIKTTIALTYYLVSFITILILHLTRIIATHALDILSPYILPNGTVTAMPDSHYNSLPIENCNSTFVLDQLPDAYRIKPAGTFLFFPYDPARLNSCAHRILPRVRETNQRIMDYCLSSTTPVSIRSVVSKDLVRHNASVISRESWAQLFASTGVASRVDLSKASIALLYLNSVLSLVILYLTISTVKRIINAFMRVSVGRPTKYRHRPHVLVPARTLGSPERFEESSRRGTRVEVMLGVRWDDSGRGCPEFRTFLRHLAAIVWILQVQNLILQDGAKK